MSTGTSAVAETRPPDGRCVRPGCITGALSVTLEDMPTSRPRHLVTETDPLAVALDAAARRWPGRSRPQLLVRLALEGDRAVGEVEEQRRRRRRIAVQEHSGLLTGAYGPGYLDDLREEWPP